MRSPRSGSETPAFEGVTGVVAFDAAGDVPDQNVYIGMVHGGAVEVANRIRRHRAGQPSMMRSLRSRVVGGMVLLIGLVFVIALLGVNSIRRAGRVGGAGADAAAGEHRPRAAA